MGINSSSSVTYSIHMSSTPRPDSTTATCCGLSTANFEMLRLRRMFVGGVCFLAVVLVLSILNGQRMGNSKIAVNILDEEHEGR